MKRFLIFPCVLCLLIGLLVGILLPINLWQEDLPANSPPQNFTAPSGVSQSNDNTSASASADTPALDPSGNFPLLGSACAVNRAIQRGDWSTLAAYVHPELGVTFTPYSTVEPDSDLTFTAEQVKGFGQDQTVYTWGFEDGRGDPIQMTAQQYFERYVYNHDYTQAPQIGIDRVITGGNALENLADAYPDSRFVDFCFPSNDPVNDGTDWSSLKLAFQSDGERWYLVAVVHGEWTI